MNKQEKAEIIQSVVAQVERAGGLFFADFTGMSVVESEKLRREFRKAGVEYTVVKNTLIQKALEQIGGYDGVFEHLAGPTGVVFATPADPTVPAKVIRDFAKVGAKPRLKAAMIEQELFPGTALEQIASMPNREQMLASIMGSLQAPASNLVGVVTAVMRNLAYVVRAVAEKQHGPMDEATAEAA